MKAAIKFNLEPKYHEIEMAAERVSSFLKSLGFQDDAVQVPTMILRELIKNSIKYSKFTPAANEIAIRLQIDKNTYTIEVSNPVDKACKVLLKELDKTIQFIRGYQDPHEAYSIRLASVNAEANDLGLEKIAYEAGIILDFYVSEDNFLNLSAVGSLNGHDIL